MAIASPLAESLFNGQVNNTQSTLTQTKPLTADCARECVISTGESETELGYAEANKCETECTNKYRAIEGGSKIQIIAPESNFSKQIDTITAETSHPTNKTYADASKRKSMWRETEKNEGWITVHRKRYGNKFSANKGKACLEQNCKFKAADTKIPLFITNVHKDVSEADIEEYVFDKTKEKISPIKIKMLKERNYNAYKFFVSKSRLDVFLNDSLWPTGISFRRFVHLKDTNYVNEERQAERLPLTIS
ncbi:hypothetical protein PYW08_007147 [Mythimna loreyi]|uniref:Uncharacterized protein n=1 Tax=Mythimna loreyi TaxID=667449 RepID=A0ACC2RAY3_9NEOP|nr:hypothetical protein PYW08_007147 [Mythimna loreyi]